MSLNEWTVLGVCVITLLAAIGVHIQTMRWIRRMVAADTELMSQLRMVMKDVLSRDPQIAESIELALHELDDWDKRIRRLGTVAFMRSPNGRKR